MSAHYWIDLVVIGDPAQVAPFQRRVAKSSAPLSFEQHIPTPAYLSEDLGVWRASHWGPLHDATAVVLAEQRPHLLTYRFDTEWSTPIPWLREVARLHPDLRFILGCQEPMMSFSEVHFFGRWGWDGTAGVRAYAEMCSDGEDTGEPPFILPPCTVVFHDTDAEPRTKSQGNPVRDSGPGLSSACEEDPSR